MRWRNKNVLDDNGRQHSIGEMYYAVMNAERVKLMGDTNRVIVLI